MPTGVALRDVREQLFAAAERILLRAGAYALTSRAVTGEAGVAKGVLHRYFTDFDAFLAELVLDRIARIDLQAAGLRDRAGTGTVDGNLTDALTALFSPVTAAIVSLIISRDDLRVRLCAARPTDGVPALTEATDMIASYLTVEREMGRIAADADVATLALMLVGAGHVLFAGRTGNPPHTEAVGRIVRTAMADVMQRRLL